MPHNFQGVLCRSFEPLLSTSRTNRELCIFEYQATLQTQAKGSFVFSKHLFSFFFFLFLFLFLFLIFFSSKKENEITKLEIGGEGGARLDGMRGSYEHVYTLHCYACNVDLDYKSDPKLGQCTSFVFFFLGCVHF